MSWLRIDKNLPGHYKTIKLAAKIRLDPDATVGRLLRLWSWCLDYAESGDLRSGRGEAASKAIGVRLRSLIESGFIDRNPYLRIHDWWDYAGTFLVSKYRRSPEKWQTIRNMYSNSYVTCTVPATAQDNGRYGRTDVRNEDVTDVTDVTPPTEENTTPDPLRGAATQEIPTPQTLPPDPIIQKQIEAQSYEAGVRRRLKARLKAES